MFGGTRAQQRPARVKFTILKFRGWPSFPAGLASSGGPGPDRPSCGVRPSGGGSEVGLGRPRRVATPRIGGQQKLENRSIFVQMHRLLRSREAVYSALRPAFAIVTLLLVLLTLGRTARADEAVARERIGMSEGVSGAELPDPRQSPSDAPRLGAGRLAPTPLPPGFTLFDGGWLRLYYHPSNRERMQALISESTVIRRQLSERFGVPVLKHVRVDVARTPGEMATLAPTGAPYPDYASGVAYPELGLVLLTLAPPHPSTDHDLVEVFRHELAHVALFEAVAGAHVPRWFNEGLAVFVSGETSVTRLQTLWTATVADTLIPLSQLDKSFPANENDAGVAYAEAVDVVRYLVRQREHFRFQGLVERMRAGQEFASALKAAYGIDMVDLEQEWRDEVAKRYTFWPVVFSGSAVWSGVLGLFVLGWRKRRKQARLTLERWEREEAREDALRAPEPASASRIHIVLARNAQPGLSMPPPSENEVPKVQHNGQWHTLH